MIERNFRKFMQGVSDKARVNMSGLIDRTRRRFNTPIVQGGSWWECLDELCAASIACSAEILDELGVRFPLDLVISGSPDNRHFRTTGTLVAPSGGVEQIVLRAPDNRTLVVSSVIMTPVPSDPIPSSDTTIQRTEITSVLRHGDVRWDNIINPTDLINGGTSFNQSRINSFLDRVVLVDDDTLTYRIREITKTLPVRWDIEIKGWIK